MSDLERRLTGTLRAAPGKNRITGYASMFGVRYDVGSFVEEIAPGAFAGVIGHDVRALFNHSPDHILGRTKARTLRLAEDDRGLHFEVDLNSEDPSAMTLLARVRRGDITGASFSFLVEPDGERWTTEGGKKIRRIHRFAKLFDVGPVTFPASEATEVSARANAKAGESTSWRRTIAYERERLRLAAVGAPAPAWSYSIERERLRLAAIQ